MWFCSNDEVGAQKFAFIQMRPLERKITLFSRRGLMHRSCCCSFARKRIKINNLICCAVYFYATMFTLRELYRCPSFRPVLASFSRTKKKYKENLSEFFQSRCTNPRNPDEYLFVHAALLSTGTRH